MGQFWITLSTTSLIGVEKSHLILLLTLVSQLSSGLHAHLWRDGCLALSPSADRLWTKYVGDDVPASSDGDVVFDAASYYHIPTHHQPVSVCTSGSLQH